MPVSIIIPPAMKPVSDVLTVIASSTGNNPEKKKQLSIEAHAKNNFEFLSMLAGPASRVRKVISSRDATDLNVLGGGRSARSLDALGVLIVDDLGEMERKRAEELGAQVFPNVVINLVEPTSVAPIVALDTWHLKKINVEAARAKGLVGTAVRIGILDTGIDPAHPEFAGKNIQFMEFDSSGRPISSRARDTGNHGTHVCGLAAGTNCGVAPDSSLAVAAVLNGHSGTLASIAGGLNWLIGTAFEGGDVKVMNASLGATGFHNFLYSPLKAAYTAPGLLLIAAIGNSGSVGINNHGSPGNYDIVEGIGATEEPDTVAGFSDWGNVGVTQKPDICAPGVELVSSTPGGAYQKMSGTSMASPVCCGAAALLIQRSPSYYGDPVALRKEIERLTIALPTPRAGIGRLDLTSI